MNVIFLSFPLLAAVLGRKDRKESKVIKGLFLKNKHSSGSILRFNFDELHFFSESLFLIENAVDIFSASFSNFWLMEKKFETFES